MSPPAGELWRSGGAGWLLPTEAWGLPSGCHRQGNRTQTESGSFNEREREPQIHNYVLCTHKSAQTALTTDCSKVLAVCRAVFI